MKKVAFLIALLFIGASGLVFWKTIDYRERLHEITDNKKVEQCFSSNDVYRDGSIVFFGDSEISGWPLRPYFGVLPIRNRGIKGDWASKAVGRFDRDVLRYHPKTVLILIGTNDIGHQKEKDVVSSIDTMIKKALQNNISVLLCSVLPVNGIYTENHPAETIRAVNADLKKLAKEWSIVYIDLYSDMANSNGILRPKYTDDGLHPNDAGYLVMTRKVYPALLAANP